MVTQTKVAILIPSGDDVKADFALSLARMIDSAARDGIQTRVINYRSSLISASREKLADMAIESEAEHVLWLDSDMVFPSWTLSHLLALNADIAASNYCRRGAFRAFPTAFEKIDWSDRHIANFTTEGDTPIEVDSVGFGCVLMKSAVLRAIRKPRFPNDWIPEAGIYAGEDIGFCGRARQAGFRILADPVLSRLVGHTGTHVYTLTTPLPHEVAKQRAWAARP